ncbi:DUF5819 family protein [Streptomyces flavidovirens]|uniref:DUF5819 family protein n=1 Tax=Streptomyces flavidovirens TaxID=67298 RepID=UPI0004229363|nr:DUF5819 family protein [Streptomyces flavidovirens]
MLPEFEQGWRLYAPDPGMSRELVQARVRVAGVRGTVTSRWIDVTALHRKAVRGRLFLGHAELERMNAAVDLYDGFTGPAGRPQGWQGRWAQRHLCRALLPWLAPYAPPGRITQMQVRMLTSHLPAPPWQTASHDRGGRRAVPAVREVSRWLTVRPEDRKVSR